MSEPTLDLAGMYRKRREIELADESPLELYRKRQDEAVMLDIGYGQKTQQEATQGPQEAKQETQAAKPSEEMRKADERTLGGLAEFGQDNPPPPVLPMDHVTVDDILTAPSRGLMWAIGQATESDFNPTGTINLMDPEQAQKANDVAEGIGQFASDFTQAQSQWNEGTLNLFTAQSAKGFAHIIGNMDRAAAWLGEKTGGGYEGGLKTLADALGTWAETYADKVPLPTFGQRFMAGVLGAPLGIAEFKAGPLYAAFSSLAETGDAKQAVTATLQRMMMGKVFDSLGYYGPATRMAGGGAAMTLERAATEYGQTGKLPDAAELGDTMAVGSALGALGGFGPGESARARSMMDPARMNAIRRSFARQTDAYKEIKSAYDAKETDLMTLKIAEHLLAETPTAMTSVQVMRETRAIRKGIDDWILRMEGIDPAKSSGDHIITGEMRPVLDAERNLSEIAVKLYRGHDSTTLVEEWMHRFYKFLPREALATVKNAYESEYLASKPGQPMSLEEWFAKEGTRRFFNERMWNPTMSPVMTKIREAWDGFVRTIKGVPGSQDMEALKDMWREAGGKVGWMPGGQKYVPNIDKSAFQVGGRRPMMQAGDLAYQVAFHGSPYRFDKFTLDHVGEGEGAQAEGWGLYFAGNKEVAEYYRQALAGEERAYTLDGESVDINTLDPLRKLAMQVVTQPGLYGRAAENLRRAGASLERVETLNSYIAEYQGRAEFKETPKGQLYEVTIPDDHTMLDWDKPLSEQPEKVKKALEAAGVSNEKTPEPYDGMALGGGTTLKITPEGGYFMLSGDAEFRLNRADVERLIGVIGEEKTGQRVYQELVEKLGSDRAASEYLKSIGIPGLRYLDGTSRGKGEGHHNYVVFDDAAIDIVGEYYQIRPADPLAYARELLTADVPAPDQKYADGTNLNLQRITAPDDIKAMLNRLSLMNREAAEKEGRGHIPNATTRELAQDLGMTVDSLLERRQGQAFNAEEILAARQILQDSAVQLMALCREVSTKRDDYSRKALAEYLPIHNAIQAEVAGLTAEAGRALQILAAPVEGLPDNLAMRQLSEVLERHGGRGKLDHIAEMMMNLADLSANGKISVKQVNSFAKAVEKPGAMDMIQEFWINSLLSGPQTHATNCLSNTIVAALAIPERWAAEQVGKGRAALARMRGREPDPDRVRAGEAAAMLQGMLMGMKDGLSMAGRTLRTGASMDPMGKIETVHRAISAESLGINPDNWLGRGVDFLADWAIRLPGKMLMAEDDFFKTVGYRMEVWAQAVRQANSEGLEGPKYTARVRELVDNPPPQVRYDATLFARYQTFTNDLGPLGKMLQRMPNAKLQIQHKNGKVSTVPIGSPVRFIIPFMRTPVNILKYGAARTPFASVMPSFYRDLSQGGAAKDLAIARVTLGSTIAPLIMMGARAGLITGGGPDDPQEMANWRQAGWQPYSLHIGGKYYSYSRLAPVGDTLALMADAAQVWDYMSDGDAERVAGVLASIPGKYITDKTYLQGLTMALDALDDPDRYGEAWVRQFSGSFVPFGGLASQVNREYVDHDVRRARTILDQMKAKVPGMSKDVPPLRDRWGYPVPVKDRLGSGVGLGIVSPIQYTEEATPANAPMYDVDKIIHQNDIQLPDMRDKTSYLGARVELTPQEFDRYVVLARGEESGLHEALYDAIGRPYFDRATGGPEGGKAQIIKNLIYSYQDRAKAKLYEETYGEPGGFAERVDVERDRMKERKQGAGYNQ